MEIKVEALDNSLPPKCFVSVRAANVQKQAPYDPKTSYRFSEARRSGKVDIYQRIGTCDFNFSGDDQETRVCRALDAHKSDTGMRLKVSMARTAAVPEKAGARQVKADSAAKSAKYLSERGVEEMLTCAMRALLKCMPDDAPAFLCDFIETRYGKRKSSAPTDGGNSPDAKRGAGSLPAPKVNAEYYRGHILKGCGEDYFSMLHSGSGWADLRGAGKPQAPIGGSGWTDQKPLDSGSKPMDALKLAVPTGSVEYYRQNVLKGCGGKAFADFHSQSGWEDRRKGAAGAQPAVSSGAGFKVKPSVGTWMSARSRLPLPLSALGASTPASAPLVASAGTATSAALATTATTASAPAPLAAAEASRRGSWSLELGAQAMASSMRSSREEAASQLKGSAPRKDKIFQVKPSVGTWITSRRCRLPKAVADQDEGA